MGRIRQIATALASASCAALLTACMTAATSSGSPHPSEPVPAPSPTPGAAATAGAVPRPDHVVIVVLENEEQGEVMDEAPFLASLAAAGTSLTDMHAETHPSQPNYLALFSGDTQGVSDDDCPRSFPGPSLGGELLAAGLTFAAYSEDLPEAGFTGCRHEGYARKHAPWANFTDVPEQLHQPLTAMPTDFARLPTVSFVIPNLCHDMHDCPVAQGDAWMREHLGDYATWARTHNSLLLVTFDESESHGDPNNHIATIAVGQGVTQGPDPEHADHYSLLRTLQELYALPPLGHSADAAPLTFLRRRAG
ncbi:alkaline phosphatase family protein [Pseudonocardia adelaidensis]|uniref:Alkaline phosphatase family protein n=1 Tax=Pseudonocardia adelaidensis TaxID=648754 RepID=A0ABP9NJI7_9PSEU